jgi:hypothetical protein
MVLFSLTLSTGWAARDGGYDVTSSLWAKAVLQVATSPVTPVTLKWKSVGADITPSGDQVISGYFYADPADFAYGSQYNPEVFVKIYIAKNGWCNIAFNHVTVDAVSVYSAHNYSGAPNKSGSVTLSNRLAEHQYDGVSIDTGLGANKVGAMSGPALASTATDDGYIINSGLWAKAVLQVQTSPVTPVTLIWKEVGVDTTATGARVVSGYFYADPNDFAYGSEFNPEIFVKIYIAPNGWANIASNHVTVDPVSFYSSYQYNGAPNQSGSVALTKRLTEQSYTGVQIEEVTVDVAEKVSSLMETFSTSGEVLTPLTTQLTTVLGAAISPGNSTVPITVTPAFAQIDWDNPPSAITINLNYGSGYTADDGALMTGSMNISITSFTQTETGISLNIAVSADQIMRNGALVLDCDLSLSANVVTGDDLLSADLSVNIVSMVSPAGSLSGRIDLDVPSLSTDTMTFQPITLSFTNLDTERVDITSGSVVLSSTSASNFKAIANLTTSKGLIAGTILLDMSDETQSVLNSQGDFQLQDYTLDIINVIFKPDVCDSYPVSGNVIIDYGAETHTMTFDGNCDYDFQ